MNFISLHLLGLEEGGVINELRADVIRSIKSGLRPKTDYSEILFGVVMK